MKKEEWIIKNIKNIFTDVKFISWLLFIIVLAIVSYLLMQWIGVCGYEQYIWIPSLISVVIGIFLYCTFDSNRLQRIQKWIKRMIVRYVKRDPISAIGIFIAILSIFATAFWDVLIQHKDWKDPIKNMYNEGYTKNWSNFTSESDTIPQKIIFILDDSESLKKEKAQPYEGWNDIVKEVVSCTWFDDDTSEKRFKPDTTKMSGVVQTRLMWLLTQLNDNKNKISGEYAIWKFSAKVAAVDFKPISSENLRASFNTINRMAFNGTNTDFLELLKSINAISREYDKNNSKKVEYTLVFLSDFIHDTGNKSEKDSTRIREELEQFKRYSLFSNLYYFELDKNKVNTGYHFIDEFKKYINPSDYEIINITDNKPILFSCINAKEVFPFYYSSSLYGNDITTLLKFDSLKNPNDFYISLKKHGDDNLRQEFRLARCKWQYY